MSHDSKVHPAQTAILRELLFYPEARFSTLQKKTNLESDHFKFHTNRLLETGYIEKNEAGKYVLTQKGKEFANKLDTDNNSIERQPKSAVIIVVQASDGRVLIQERLKQPYYGFYGYPGGKIRWGETIMQAAERELKEETGLDATLAYRGVYHEHVKSAESGDLLEDKIFHVVSGVEPTGSFMERFEGGRNEWMSVDDLEKQAKKYASCDIETAVGLGRESFIEKIQTYRKDEF